MTGRERLMATLQGRPVDRPAVNFYEIGGLVMDPTDPEPFNIYSDPSWQRLLELAETRTDLIRMRSAVRTHSHQAWGAGEAASSEFFRTEHHVEEGRRMTRTTLTIGGRTMTSQTRRDREVDTVWTVEHLLKSNDDVRAYLELPDEALAETVDVTP
ncbi:MAG: hypothetical protein JSW27_08610, partial [Phycisphaerales bacterium]